MFVCCECRVLPGRGLCDELITLPEESYRLWCVVMYDLVNLMNEEAMAHWGVVTPNKKKNITMYGAKNIRLVNNVEGAKLNMGIRSQVKALS